MSGARGVVAGADPAHGSKRRRTRDLQILRDPRLWTTVGLVAVLAIVWLVILVLADHPPSASTTTFLPLGVFLIPVLYASITFGLGGGLVLAIVSGVATIPWAYESLSQHDTLGAWFDLVQVMVLIVVAYFVGKAVRAERQARQAAERSRQDHLLAEVRYRDLFETNSQAILLVDLLGGVHEANVAAAELFAPRVASLHGASLADLLGREVFDRLRAGRPVSALMDASGRTDGSPAVVLRPVGRPVTIDGEPMVQVVLQDVTEDERRRQLAQAYAADILRGQEDERRRIAQELHDGPLQTLVHVCRLIDAVAAGDRPGPAQEEATAALARLRTATESVVAEVRQISRGLRPPLLDDLGLPAALQRLCDDVELRAGVAVSLRADPALPRLSPPTELAVYRIAQEALSNVDRHAAASTVGVAVWAAEGWLHLRVADDGAGFDAEPGSPRLVAGTLGLTGMSERAELVGGYLQVRSTPGAGTTVAVAVPVGAGAPPEAARRASPVALGEGYEVRR